MTATVVRGIYDKATKPRPQLRSRLMLFGLMFGAACLMLFADLGRFPLFNPDEGLYAEPAREMLDTGEYVTTLLNYVVRFTKPPLVIWLMAGCYKIFGVNEFAARFPGAVCAALLVGCTYLFLERYASRRAAWIGAASLVTAPLFLGTAREAITDMPLSLFVAGSLLAFYHAFAQKSPLWRWPAYFLIGLAVMTKGPVGAVLPALTLVVYHGIKRELGEAWRFYKPLAGLLIVAAIALPWFAIEIAITKGAYFYEFLVRENFQRFTGVVDHKGAWWYHIAAMFGGFLPWSVFLPQAIYGAISQQVRAFRSAFAESESELADKRSHWRSNGNMYDTRQTSDLCLFATCSALTILLFFSVSVSKLLPYTLPAFPALAILVGVELDRAVNDRRYRLAVPFAVLTLAYAGGLYAVPSFIERLRDLPNELPDLIQSFLSVELAVMAAAMTCLLRGRAWLAIVFFTLTTYLSFFFFGAQAIEVLSQEWEEPLPIFAQYASVADWPIIVYDMRKPAIPFYTHRQVILPAGQKDLLERLYQLNCAYILTRVADEPFFKGLPGCKVIAERGRFILVAFNLKHAL